MNVMYHYLESGLRNVYLTNGYREVDTPYGRGVSIHEVEALHIAIAHALVETKSFLTGRKVRFIRKFLELTQTQFAALLGVEDQSLRRWENLVRVPKQADHGFFVRISYGEFRDSLSPCFCGAPNRIRTGVLALRGLCPGPLDDGSGVGSTRRSRAL
jgi:putative transcriptional regulator